MCCETCLRYTSCEGEDHLSELCCTVCMDYASCHSDSRSNGEGSDEIEDSLNEA